MTQPKYETALITGGSTGIGAAMARSLAKRGTRVLICGRRQDMLDQLLLELGDRGVGLCADVADPERAAKLVDDAVERLGSLDLVIANAGTGGNRPATRMTPKDVIRILNLNVLGACATIAAAIPHMMKQGRGHLVGISSIAGMRGLPTSAAYSASKAALSTFLESIRVDLYRTGIRVTDVRPGFVDTPLTKKNKFKMPFLVDAEVAGEKIVRAIEAERRVFTFPFPMWIASMLLTMIPAWLYDRVGSRGAPKTQDT
jgi:short-subunit dehydrogenase